MAGMEYLTPLLRNTAYLMVFGFFYHLILKGVRLKRKSKMIFSGCVLTFLGIMLMSDPLRFSPGVIFDTRSILISVSGLFYGAIPTVILMFGTSIFRLYQGGEGALTGIGVIFSSGMIGLGWRYYFKRKLTDLNVKSLAVVGLSVHIVMLIWMLSLDWNTSLKVMKELSFPILTVYPLGVVFLGELFIIRIRENEKDLILKESEKKFHDYIEFAPLGVFVANENGYYVEVNEMACEITGYYRKELTGMNLLDLIVEEDKEMAIKSFNALKIQNERNSVELKYMKKNGEIRYWVVYAIKVSPHSFLGFVRDTTDSVTRKKQLERKNRALKVLNRMSLEIVRTINENELYERLCRVLVSEGKYVQAGVVFCNDNMEWELAEMFPMEEKRRFDDSVVMAKFVDKINELIRESGEGLNQAVFFKDIFGDNKYWLLSPISNVEEIYSYFLIASGEEWADDEIKLIEETGGDLGLWIYSNRLKEQKSRLNKKLRETESRYVRLFETIPQGVIYHDMKGAIFSINPSAKEMLGISAEEAYGENIDSMNIEMIYEDGRICPINEQPVSIAFETGKPVMDQILGARNRKTGTYRWLNVCAIPEFKGDDSKPCQVYSTFMDLTEKKKAEQKLKESEEKIRQIFSNAPVGIFRTTLSGKALEVNQEMANIVGCETPEEAIRDFTDLASQLYVHKARRKEFLERLKKYGEVINFEYEAINRKGKRIWISMNARLSEEPVTGEKVIDGFSADITNKKKAQIASRENEKRFKSAIDNAPYPVLIHDEKGNILILNEEWKRLSGYSYGDLKTIDDWLMKAYPDNYSRIREVAKNVYQIDEIKDMGEFEILTKGGSKRIWRFKAAPLGQLSGKGRLIMSMAVDLTEVRENEERLKMALEKAEESERLKTAFLANMSHEIRTPMNAIVGFSSLLKDERDHPERQEEYIRIIQSKGKQLLRLINDIIDVSKLEAKQMKIKELPFDLNEVFKEIQSTYKNIIERKDSDRQVQLKVNVNVNKLGKKKFVKGDRLRLVQILTNLLDNAVKFTKIGTIETGYIVQDEKKIMFYVKDTGIGMPHDQIGCIFDRFRQLDDSYTRNYGGTGLGLNIVKNLVYLMGGEIQVESQPGMGSYFSFVLPLVECLKGPYAQGEKKRNRDGLKKRKILIVEDDPINRYYLKVVLEKNDARCLVAENGGEAVERARLNSGIDVVLMDLKLPILDGYEAAKIIKDEHPQLPIIAQSAYAMEEELGRIRHSVFDGYIVKPIDERKLFELISGLLVK